MESYVPYICYTLFMREHVRNIVSKLQPLDKLESSHIEDTLNWIDSDEEIFRLEKPATPPMHLVSYFIVVDPSAEKLLLVDHIKAELWLPAGGHVEKDEDPKETVRREILEELHFPADFIYEDPIFITQTITVGKTAGHTDVSLWYVVRGDISKEITFDKKEFNDCKWFSFTEIMSMPAQEFDPHMHRFTKKLLNILSTHGD